MQLHYIATVDDARTTLLASLSLSRGGAGGFFTPTIKTDSLGVFRGGEICVPLPSLRDQSVDIFLQTLFFLDQPFRGQRAGDGESSVELRLVKQRHFPQSARVHLRAHADEGADEGCRRREEHWCSLRPATY